MMKAPDDDHHYFLMNDEEFDALTAILNERLNDLDNKVCPSPGDCTCSKPDLAETWNAEELADPKQGGFVSSKPPPKDLSDPYPKDGPDVRERRRYEALSERLDALEGLSDARENHSGAGAMLMSDRIDKLERGRFDARIDELSLRLQKVEHVDTEINGPAGVIAAHNELAEKVEEHTDGYDPIQEMCDNHNKLVDRVARVEANLPPRTGPRWQTVTGALSERLDTLEEHDHEKRFYALEDSVGGNYYGHIRDSEALSKRLDTLEASPVRTATEETERLNSTAGFASELFLADLARKNQRAHPDLTTLETRLTALSETVARNRKSNGVGHDEMCRRMEVLERQMASLRSTFHNAGNV